MRLWDLFGLLCRLKTVGLSHAPGPGFAAVAEPEAHTKTNRDNDNRQHTDTP